MTPHTEPDPLDNPFPDIPEGETVDLSLEGDLGLGDLQSLEAELEQYNPDNPQAAPQVHVEDAGMDRDQLAEALAKARVRLEVLEKAEQEHHDKHHRLMADFVNYRNRATREIELAVTLAERKLLTEFLPVSDSFERCLSASYRSVEDFHAGAALIHKQLAEALRKAGAEPVPLNVGDPFDAQNAEALTTTTQPGLADGAVAAIYERGYTFKDQLLRPARVIVNHQPSEDGA